MTLGLTDGTYTNGITSSSLGYGLYATGQIGNVGEIVETDQPMSTGKLIGVTTDQTKSGIISNRASTESHKYLEFYLN